MRPRKLGDMLRHEIYADNNQVPSAKIAMRLFLPFLVAVDGNLSSSRHNKAKQSRHRQTRIP